MLQFKNSINFKDELFVSMMNLTILRTPSSPNSPSHIRNDFKIGIPFSPLVERRKAVANALAPNSPILSFTNISFKSSPSSNISSIFDTSDFAGVTSFSLHALLYAGKKFSVGLSSSSWPFPFFPFLAPVFDNY
jgi:hypothetical protein